MKLGLEKFNLGLAVSGARKVVTREGIEVTELIYNNRADSWPLHGYVNGLEVLWSIDGTYELGGAENGLDLFLMPEEVGREVDEDQEWWSKGGKYTIADENNNMDLMTVVDDVKPYSKPESEYAVGNYVEAIEEANRSTIFGLTEDHVKEFIKNISPEIKKTVEEVMGDPVNRPSHYTDGKIEVIDFIDDKKFDFCIGNAIKYLSRAGKKQNEIEDLEKAVWYINHKIQKLKKWMS